MLTEDKVIEMTEASMNASIDAALRGERGAFMQNIAKAGNVADSGNTNKLRKAFPELMGRCRHTVLVEIEVSWTDKVDPSEIVELLGPGLVSEIATSIERTCAEVDINVESVRTV